MVPSIRVHDLEVQAPGKQEDYRADRGNAYEAASTPLSGLEFDRLFQAIPPKRGQLPTLTGFFEPRAVEQAFQQSQAAQALTSPHVNFRS